MTVSPHPAETRNVRTPGREASHAFLLGLAAALAAQDPPVTLVLDDLHLLTDPGVLDGLDYVLRNAGPGLRLVVSARMDPLLPLHRYRLAGRLAEIGTGDLAFTVAEAGLLLARHGHTLTPGSLERLTRRTGGWVAGLRLAAISMGTHPDPGQFAEELITDDSALTGYLVQEVLGTQPPAVRDVLLNTSILEQVNAQAARELTGNERAGTILPALAHANGFVQPIGSGWYRYHPLFAEVLRLTLKRDHPDRLAPLHRAAARWYERNGQLTDAVRHAARASDWPLAASIVIDGLAIGEIIGPRGTPSLADELAGLPHGQAWTGPEPHLVSAAVALSAGRPAASTSALDAADGILARLPADQQAESRLAAAMIRLAASRRTGDFMAAAAPAAITRRRRRLPSPTRGRRPDTPRTRRVRSHRCSPPAAGHPNAFGCRRGWWTLSSATATVIAREAAAPLPARCGWPNPNSSGCRSSSSVTGSDRYCGVTPNWPAPTSACSHRPHATTCSRPPRAPQTRPPSSWPSRSPNASRRSYGICQACSAPPRSPARCTSP